MASAISAAVTGIRQLPVAAHVAVVTCKPRKGSPDRGGFGKGTVAAALIGPLAGRPEASPIRQPAHTPPPLVKSALAAAARHHAIACVEGTRQGYRTVRIDLGEHIAPHAIDAVLNAYHTEGKRLVATARAVDLVERALGGETPTRSF